jgi:flagellar biosynthesis/type III secretory pathway chaperone
MTSSDCWSEILVISSRLLKLISLLTSKYERLPKIIAKEHAAIRTNDFTQLQQTCQEKSEIGDLIAQHFSEFRTETDALFLLAGASVEIVKQEPKGYNEVIELFDTMVSQLEEGSVWGPEIKKRRSQLAESFKSFREKFEAIQPIIENNRTVVRTMLEHQQQSFRFWAEIVQEESSSYDASGSRKSKGGGSLISIQA